MAKVINVFYDAQGYPFKDKELTTRYPIVGSAFMGADNTTEIRFYVDELSANRQWAVFGKLPNGKKGFKVLTESVLDEDEDRYYPFLLSQFFTQYKGDLYLSLGGYYGNIVELSEEQEYELQQVSGEMTGAIKLQVAYSVQMEGSDYDELPQWLQALASKLDTNKGIVVIPNQSASVSGYNDGQLFYSKADNKFYVLSNGILVLFANPLENDIGVITVPQFTGTLTNEQYAETQKKYCILLVSGANIYTKGSEDSNYIYFYTDTDVVNNVDGDNTYAKVEKDSIVITKSTKAFEKQINVLQVYNKSQLETYVYNYLQPHIQDYNALNTLVGQIVALMPNSVLPIGETLATQSFVNSTVENLAATPRGNFNTQLDVLAVAWQDTDDTAPNFVANNDFAYVNEVVSGTIIGEWNSADHIGEAWKFSYSKSNPDVTGQWLPDIKINNAPFTQAQIDAINSGITQALVQLIQTNASNIVTLNNKLPKMILASIEPNEWVETENENQWTYEIDLSDYGYTLGQTDEVTYANSTIEDGVILDTYNIVCGSDSSTNKIIIKTYFGKPNATYHFMIKITGGVILQKVGE